MVEHLPCNEVTGVRFSIRALMRKFTSGDSFKLIAAGGNKVYTFPKEQLPEDLWDPGQMKGETVEIDGKQYQVLGVETYQIFRSPQSPYRLSFGLLVKE